MTRAVGERGRLWVVTECYPRPSALARCAFAHRQMAGAALAGWDVEVRVPNGKGELLSGMYATARIETSRAADAVTIPRDAVATRDGKRVVLRVAEGKVQPTAVTEGIRDEGRVQILAGLATGDVIVADARKSLPPGTRVRAVTE